MLILSLHILYLEDVLKSAIKLQQQYHADNQLKTIRDQVYVRISVHFGYGIIEENDISRDAINAESWFIDTFSLSCEERSLRFLL